MALVHLATASGLFTFGDRSGVDLEDRDIAAIATDDGGWWAIAGNSILRGAPGSGWDEVATTEGRAPNCIRPTIHGVFVGTDRAHLLRVDGATVIPVEGFEDAPGRDDWYTPWGGPPAVRSIATSEGAVHVNVHVGGILSSGDGREWSPTIDIHSDVHEVIASGDILIAATAFGLAVSPDRGGSWEFTEDGLHASYARAVALAGDQVLMTASLGPRGGRGAIFRRPLHGSEPFERIHTGLPEWFPDNLDSGCVSARDNVAAFGTSDGRAYVSEDRGAAWNELAHDLPEVRAVVVEP
jgi:hypothetical protein